LVDILRHEHETTKLPYSRMVLAGFSQGGALSLWTGMRLSEKVSGHSHDECVSARCGQVPAHAGLGGYAHSSSAWDQRPTRHVGGRAKVSNTSS
jgi:hypothetical protein